MLLKLSEDINPSLGFGDISHEQSGVVGNIDFHWAALILNFSLGIQLKRLINISKINYLQHVINIEIKVWENSWVYHIPF